MIKEIVLQKTTYICDKCGKSIVVETELEECYGKYEMIEADAPREFNELEDLELDLCDVCLSDLKSWITNK